MRGLKLNKDTQIPALGLGTWNLRGDMCIDAVEYAFEVGYRHLDTADIYGNHREIAKTVKSSGIKRDEIFITSKVWRNDLVENKVVDAGKRFLDELEMEYIDLLLIHWPDSNIPVKGTLQGFQKLKDEGVIKAIGVSNFMIKQMKEVLDTGIQVTNNQIEYHPIKQQKELKQFCDHNGVTVTAYSPLDQGKALNLPLIKDLAKKYDRSESQVILNWLIAKNMIVIPRSGDPRHIKDNFETIQWKLNEEDVKSIDEIK